MLYLKAPKADTSVDHLVFHSGAVISIPRFALATLALTVPEQDVATDQRGVILDNIRVRPTGGNRTHISGA